MKVMVEKTLQTGEHLRNLRYVTLKKIPERVIHCWIGSLRFAGTFRNKILPKRYEKSVAVKKQFQYLFGMLLIAILCCSNATMAEEATKMSLRIASFNIRRSGDKQSFRDWGHRKKLVLKDLRRMNPDLFGLQEASPNQIIDLKEFGFRHIGHGRNRNLAGEAVPVFYDPRLTKT